MRGMDFPESAVCPSCGQSAESSFRVWRYAKAGANPPALVVLDCDYSCPCGAAFSNRAGTLERHPGSKSPLLVVALLAVLNAAFDLSMRVVPRRG